MEWLKTAQGHMSDMVSSERRDERGVAATVKHLGITLDKYCELNRITSTARKQLVRACAANHLECYHIQEAVNIVSQTIAKKDAEIAKLKAEILYAERSSKWEPGCMK
jgi:hypothetical protein